MQHFAGMARGDNRSGVFFYLMHYKSSGLFSSFTVLKGISVVGIIVLFRLEQPKSFLRTTSATFVARGIYRRSYTAIFPAYQK
jgi:hypothetical protein